MLALWRGWLPSVIGVIPYVGLNFAVYETSKDAILSHYGACAARRWLPRDARCTRECCVLAPWLGSFVLARLQSFDCQPFSCIATEVCISLDMQAEGQHTHETITLRVALNETIALQTSRTSAT